MYEIYAFSYLVNLWYAKLFKFLIIFGKNLKRKQ